jgi:hypothetical protein
VCDLSRHAGDRMKWDQARANMPCDRGTCDKWIAPGQAFRWMAGKLKYCVACAYASTKEQPPVPTSAPRAASGDPLPTLKRFVAPAGLDAKALQARNED